MKFKKLTAVTLIIITLLSALALTATAEEQKDKGTIPESIPTESVNLDIEYGVYVAVKPFDGNRSFAVAPFSRFSVSEDGSRVVLTFPSDSGTAVAVFSLTNGTMELVRGFDIALSETAIPRIYGDSVTVWLKESEGICDVERVKEGHIRRYIMELQSRGKYTACIDQRMTRINHPTNRRDYKDKVSSCTINNYLRNLRVFFNWLEEAECIVQSPMKKVRSLPQERSPRDFMSTMR